MEEDGALGSGQATRGRENRLCAGEDPGVSGLEFVGWVGRRRRPGLSKLPERTGLGRVPRLS